MYMFVFVYLTPSSMVSSWAWGGRTGVRVGCAKLCCAVVRYLLAFNYIQLFPLMPTSAKVIVFPISVTLKKPEQGTKLI